MPGNFKQLLLPWNPAWVLSILLIILPVLVIAGKDTKTIINKSKASKLDQAMLKKKNSKIKKHVKHKYWTKSYDSYFRKYSKHYFGIGLPWHWFKAQSIAESGLNSKARSKVGAIGLMQILPSTYGDIVKKNPKLGDIKHPRWNIAGGIFYDRQIYRKWKKKGIPVSERLAFTFASYNAGYSKILRAYNKKNKDLPQKINKWSEVKKLTPGATRAYVHRIKTLMNY